MGMLVAVLTVEYALHGNDSLKGKRRIANSLKEKVRKRFHVAIAEAGTSDSLTRLRLAVVGTSNEEGHLRRRMDNCLSMMEAVCPEEMVYSDVEFFSAWGQAEYQEQYYEHDNSVPEDMGRPTAMRKEHEQQQVQLPLFQHDRFLPALRLAQTLKTYAHIGIVAHANPDADAIGATVALALTLRSIGKNVSLYNASGVPEYLAWIPLPVPMKTRVDEAQPLPEIMVVLDCGDAERIGDIKDAVLALPTINIDHHLRNPLFGSVDNWVDATMAATGLMVAAVTDALAVPMSGPLGEAIYVAVSSDTGNFAYDNASEDALLLAAHLVHMGLHIPHVRQHMDRTWHSGRMLLWGNLMQNIVYEHDGRTALVCIPLNLITHYKCKNEDVEGFVEHLRRIRHVDVAAIIREDSGTRCKISLRSTGDVDVCAMAALCGGGGHKNAAGATVKHNITNTTTILLKSIASVMGY